MLLPSEEKFSHTSLYTRSRVNKESMIPVKRETIKESNATQCNKSGKGFFSLEEKKFLDGNETTRKLVITLYIANFDEIL